MKTLILYFSYSGNTKRLVEEINAEFNFDAARIERKTPYSDDYDTCAYIEAKEEWEKKIYPEIKELNVRIDSYDRILLFFPIWWYTYPMPIGSVLKELNGFKGEIILFENSYTNDLKYVENSLNDVGNLAPELNVRQGLFNKSANEHIRVIKAL